MMANINKISSDDEGDEDWIHQGAWLKL